MPSPFPGMDPYLEDPAFWPDFHRRFINYACEALLDRLPDAYDARIDEHVRLVTPDERSRAILPDVAVLRRPKTWGEGQPIKEASSVATLEPVTLAMPEYEETNEVWIELRRQEDQSLVTVIELLSPSNKTGSGLAEYMAKRDGVLRARANLVEIDLLLAGSRFAPAALGDYCVSLTRAERTWSVDVYAWKLGDVLPTVPVPLRVPDPDIGLDLAAVFATTYDRGRYARALRYGQPAAWIPEESRGWAAERASAARRRD